LFKVYQVIKTKDAHGADQKAILTEVLETFGEKNPAVHA